MSTVITSSNRSSSEWASYIERHRRTSLASIISESPHIGTAEIIARNAINPPGPFDHVIAVDECGAPITANTIGGEITLARLEESC